MGNDGTNVFLYICTFFMAGNCPNTPAFKSRYCSVHTPYVTLREVDGSDTQEPSTSPINAPKLAGIITNKRVTRTSVLYEVYFYCT